MSASAPAANAPQTIGDARRHSLTLQGELLVVVVFFLASWAGLRTSRSAGGILLFWPANAVAAAMLVRLPTVHWVWTFLSLLCAGVLASLLGTNDPLLAAVGMSAGDLLEIGLTVYLLRGSVRLPFPDITFSSGARMFALLGIVIPAIGALPRGLAASVGYNTPFWTAVTTGYISVVAGSILCAPSIYLCSTRRLRRLASRDCIGRNIAVAAGCLIVTYCAVRFVRFPLIAVGIPLIIAAFRVGAFGAALLCELVGLFIVVLWSVGILPVGMAIPLKETGPLAGLPFLAIAGIMLSPVIVGLAADDRERAMRALRYNELRFRQSLQHSPVGIVIWALDGKVAMANDACLKMLGYTREEFDSLGKQEIIHPDDQEQATRDVQSLLDGTADRYVAERRYRHRDGSWVWARVAASLVHDDEGMALHVIAHLEGLEARRKAERDLAEERERLRTTLQAIGDAVVTTDDIGQITYVNTAAENLIGQRLDEIVGRRLDDVVVLTNPQTTKTMASVFALCLARGEPVRRPERCLLHRPDGSPRYVIDAAWPVNDSDGAISGVVVVLQDATAGVEQDKELRHRAAHDPLTGLTNRFEFERRLSECFERYHYFGRAATLLLIDLDRFKEVNDSGGHAAGDEVLRRVAQALAGIVRDSDTVARLGGDEFAILLTHSDPAARAGLVGAKVLSAISELGVEWNGASHSVGASIGTASLGPQIDNPAEWVAVADRACYEAKRAGRGQMRIDA